MNFLARGVETCGKHTSVDSGDDDVFELAGRGEAEVGQEAGVGELSLVAREGKEGQLAEFEGLGVVEFGKIGGCDVGGVETVGEDGKVGMPGAVSRVLRGGECSYGGTIQKRSEDVGAGSLGGTVDKVSCCTGRSRRFGEGQEGLRICQ